MKRQTIKYAIARTYPYVRGRVLTYTYSNSRGTARAGVYVRPGK